MTTPATRTPSRRILVGVDGSPQSEAALLWAAEEAIRTESLLSVLLVRASSSIGALSAAETAQVVRDVSQHDLDQIEHARKILGELVETTLPLGRRPDFEVGVRGGDPAASLIVEAGDSNADLLVLGRRGLGGFKSLLLGSVSDQCAAHAPCPVMVVVNAPEAGSENQTILVGVDGSRASAAAMEWALDQAAQYGTRVRFVAVWTSPALRLDAMLETETEVNDTLDGYSIDAHEAVNRSLHFSRSTYPRVEVSGVVVQGDASEVLTGLAAENNVLMLVLGTRGRGTFASLVLGSVAHKCLHHAATPVVMVHAAESPAQD